MQRVRSILLVLVSVVLVGGSVAAQPPTTEFEDVTGPITTPQPTPDPINLVVPQSIEIPALGVNAPVVATELEGDTIAVPRNAKDVAWWGDSVPGFHNALFAGHRNYNGVSGSFGTIGNLKPGDKIHLKGTMFQTDTNNLSSAPKVSDAGTLEFTVEWVQSFDMNVDATEILGDQPQPVITLVTCSGPFNSKTRHYTERIVIRAINPVRI